MNEMQQMMQPMMQQIGRMQQEVCSGNPSGKEGERRLMGHARPNNSGPAIARFD
jgi:hypothetical protein